MEKIPSFNFKDNKKASAFLQKSRNRLRPMAQKIVKAELMEAEENLSKPFFELDFDENGVFKFEDEKFFFELKISKGDSIFDGLTDSEMEDIELWCKSVELQISDMISIDYLRIKSTREEYTFNSEEDNLRIFSTLEKNDSQDDAGVTFEKPIIAINRPPNTPSGLLTLFHEISHVELAKLLPKETAESLFASRMKTDYKERLPKRHKARILREEQWVAAASQKRFWRLFSSLLKKDGISTRDIILSTHRDLDSYDKNIKIKN